MMKDILMKAISDATVINQQRLDAIVDISSAISRDVHAVSTNVANLAIDVRTLRIGHEGKRID
jgi:hypothetical protein